LFPEPHHKFKDKEAMYGKKPMKKNGKKKK